MDANKLAEFGLPVLHSRVEQWECDYNNHWNVRFYARSFRSGLEALADRVGVGALPAAGRTTHIRFHRELFVGASVEVRAGRIDGGRYNGATLLLLSSGGGLSATALEMPPLADMDIPAIGESEVALALPRGIGAADTPVGTGPCPENSVFLGLARPTDFDHAGNILAEEVIRYTAIASSAFLHGLGFTPEYTAQTRINRMSVETKITRRSGGQPGEPIVADTALVGVGSKGFNVRHDVYGRDQICIATVEQGLVSVNLDTRRATANPDFIIAAASGN